MGSGGLFKLIILTVATLMLVTACADQVTDDADEEINQEPSPTPAGTAIDTGGDSLDIDELENGTYLDAIARAPFVVHVAGELPFEVVGRAGSIHEGPSEGAPTTLFLMYVSEIENTFVELRQVNAPTTVRADNVQDIELQDGTAAQFHDNEMGTSITWNDEELGVAITVSSGREDNRLPQDELLEIAANLETVDPGDLEHEPQGSANGHLPEIGEAPCEVRDPEPPRDDIELISPERIQDWLETARTFNDVAVGLDGEIYIGSYRHAAVLIPGDDGTLSDVWWDGVRNTNQVAIHPDGRLVLLQDNGIHFYDSSGAHQHYLSMFDADAGWFPDYGGIGIDSEGHVYVGVGHEQQIVKLDEGCTVLGQWPALDAFGGGAPPLIAIDGDDLVYSMLPDLNTLELRVRDQEGTMIHTWDADPPVDNALAYAITDRPEGGLAILWNVPADERVADPRVRAVDDFLVHQYAPDGELLTEWAGSDSGTDEMLAEPAGMTIAGDGTVHIVDGGVGEHRMRMHTFTADGAFIEEWRVDNDAALCAFNEHAARMVECD